MDAYLDYNATTPLDPLVFDEMRPYLTDRFGNASSFHKRGQAARHAVEEARERIARCLRVEPGDLVFTSGGTEANNLAVRGTMEWMGAQKKRLVVSAVEHQSVLHPARRLAEQGFDVVFVPVDSKGFVRMEAFQKAVTPETALVSVMHVNNEVGSIQDCAELSRIAHEAGALYHADAVQSFGKIPLDAESLGADLLTLSAHKICGPKGAGVLYARKGLKLRAILQGGHQEKNIRPGTENVAAIAGFGRAAELAAERQPEESLRVFGLRKKLEDGIFKSIQGVTLNQDAQKRIYNTLNVSFAGLDGETLLVNLDLKNIHVSTGSACTAGSVEPSHVLRAMGLSDASARAAIRFSLGRFTSGEEIDYVLRELPSVVERLRRAATQRTPSC